MAGEIVMIHGLGPKPAEDVLTRRYRKHLGESVGDDIAEDRFHVVYWADLMGYEPDTPETDEYSEDGEKFRPYSRLEEAEMLVRAKVRQHLKERLEDRIAEYLDPQQSDRPGVIQDLALNVFAQVVDRKVRWIYEHFLPDLDRYFRQGQRAPVKQKLIDALDAAGEKTCLIAHSMGSIIALDVILNDNRKVDTLVTMGSPLGLKVVQNHLGVTAANRATLPQRVSAWYNLYDRLDKVALDHDLADDFPEIPIADVRIRNFFVDQEGKRNHHKSYGYLNAPKLGGIVKEFLQTA